MTAIELPAVTGRTPWLDFFWSAPAQAVFWCTLLAVLVVVAWYVVQRFRGQDEQDKALISDLITNFRELHREGDISDAEYRTIRTMLRTKFEQDLELKDKGDEA